MQFLADANAISAIAGRDELTPVTARAVIKRIRFMVAPDKRTLVLSLGKRNICMEGFFILDKTIVLTHRI
jgi:hypothetical protein